MSAHLQTPGLEARAQTFVAAGLLEWGDLHLIDTVAPRFGEADPDRLLGLALAWRAQRSGHVGCHLAASRERLAQELLDRSVGEPPEIAWPDPVEAWERQVLGSPMVGDAEDAGRPFTRQKVAGGTLLLTRRMWLEQVRVAEQLRILCAATPTVVVSPERVAAWLSKQKDRTEEGDHAVTIAARSCVAIVTGGPGTGKTYNIRRILTLLLEVGRVGGEPLKVELAAPTGKAAVRMAEAIAEGDASPALLALKPRTIHKLLGIRPGGGSRHNKDNPLVADVVVIDEASMVDLALMRHLLEAIPTGARLILMGDKDQLASVDAGTVLADLVSAADSPVLQGRIATLTVSKRFGEAPTVYEIATAIQQRSWERAAKLITGNEPVVDWMPNRVTWTPVAGGRLDVAQTESLAAPMLHAGNEADLSPEEQDKEARDASTIGYAWLIAQHMKCDITALGLPHVQRRVLDAFDHYRILAVHRRGPLGVSGLERAMGAVLRKQIEVASGRGLPTQGGFWLGQPVLVTENAYDVDLRNGDIGIVLRGKGGLVVVFPCVRDGQRAVRQIAIARLPPHSGALAMTVHKSQGSQFKRVALVLADRASPIQTRELIYTGITRTCSRLDVLGTVERLAEGLKKDVGRGSGLGELVRASV